MSPHTTSRLPREFWGTFGYSFFYTCSLIVDSSFVGFPYTSWNPSLHELHPPHGCETWASWWWSPLFSMTGIHSIDDLFCFKRSRKSVSKHISATISADFRAVIFAHISCASRISSIGIFLMIKKYYPVPSTRSGRYIHPRGCSRAWGSSRCSERGVRRCDRMRGDSSSWGDFPSRVLRFPYHRWVGESVYEHRRYRARRPWDFVPSTRGRYSRRMCSTLAGEIRARVRREGDTGRGFPLRYREILQRVKKSHAPLRGRWDLAHG